MSGNRYFISDPHFGHAGAARHRGFNSIGAHDWVIVNGIIDTCKKGDVLWILGDITMEKPNYDILTEFTSRGIHLKVVLGNHDRPQDVPKLLEHVNCVCGMYRIGNVVLSHAPLHYDELIKYGEYNIHGHIHDLDPPSDRHINVSAEYIDYIPKTIEELLN